jgi:hypothetical protein
MRSKKKTSYDSALSFTKYRLNNLEKEFEEASKNFIWQIQQGGGWKNIHMLDTIRKLNFLYTNIAAHHDALRSLEVKI